MSLFISLLIGLSLWVYYGVLRKDMPIIVTNGLSALKTFVYFSSDLNIVKIID
jgi:uncharacterized protein with PQ loop repeat